MFRCDSTGKLSYIRAVGYIDAMFRHSDFVRPSKFDCLRNSIFVDIGKGEMTAAARQRQSSRSPNPTTRACDHSRSIFETHAISHLSMPPLELIV
jgi:hypothetical protein